MPSEFFDNLRDYSEIKLRILGRFLAPWAAKLGFWARRGNGVIWYVDGFAGPGKYDDGRDGSPTLGMRRAEDILRDKRTYQLSCFFVEKQRKRWDSLEELVDPFRQNGLKIWNKRGEFTDVIPEIAHVTRGSPVLLFVDPFGISPLKYSAFRTLISRRWPLALILTFQHKALHRLAKGYPDLITEAIGTDAWEEKWHDIPEPKMQTQHVLEIFQARIQEDGKFLEVFSYPIRPSVRSAPKYYLLFASRHYDAFELWNDEICHEEDTLSVREYERLASQATFLPEFDEEISALNLLNDVRRIGRSLGMFTRQDIVMHFVRYRWGRYHTKQVKKAVRSLVASGEIFRDRVSGGDIDTDNLYFTQ